MTVSTTTSRADYTGNGSTTAWTVPFYFLDPTHIQVIRTQISTGAAITLALTADYTVSGAGAATGGTLTTVAALTIDQRVSVLRNVPFTQLSHYVPNDPFPAATHEQIVDQLTMETQQLNETVGRALTLAQNTTGVSTSLPTPVASNVIGWNSAATALQNTPLSGLATAIVATTWTTQTFSGNGSTTAFVLATAPGNVSAIIVSVSGVVKIPAVDFNISGTTLTFIAAPASGTNNIAVQQGQSLVSLPTSGLSAPGPIGDSIPGTGAFTVLTAANGSGIAALNASNLGSGTVPNARFPATLPAASAANLTNIPAANLTGTGPGTGLALNAATITFGTLSGGVSAVTQSIGNNSTAVATTAYADAQAFRGATWQDVTGSRVTNTIYTNSTNRAIFASVNYTSGSSGGNLYMYLGGIEQTMPCFSNSAGGRTAQFLVPPGGTYRVRADGGYALSSWFELTT